MQLQAGVASIGITPPLGLPMAGYGARARPAEGIRDPLSVTALALEQGDARCGLICADLLGSPAALTAEIRARAAELCDLPQEGIFVCTTHTHWGPDISGQHVPEVLAGIFSPEYRSLAGQLAASALVEAWRRREPALALAGTGEGDSLSFNRRLVDAEGQAVMSWTLPLPRAVIAAQEGAALAATWQTGVVGGERLTAPLEALDGLRAGVTDPSLPVLKLIRLDGSPLAALFAFACHAVCGAGEEAFCHYSADYPGQARAVVQQVLGCPAIFLAGCCGDQVPRVRGSDSRRRIGRSLGAEVLRTWDLLEGEGCGPLRVGHRTVSLPARDGDGSSGVEVWSMALGQEWGLVGLPGEVLVEIGLQIKQQSPFRTTAVVELGLDDPGYVPTDAAIEEGGYEPGPSASPYGRGAEAALVAGGRAALGAVAPA